MELSGDSIAVVQENKDIVISILLPYLFDSIRISFGSIEENDTVIQIGKSVSTDTVITIRHSFTSEGNRTVTATGYLGNVNKFSSFDIKVVKGAIIPGNGSISAGGTLSEGNPFSLFVTYAGTEPVQFTWYKNNLPILNSSNDTLTFTKFSSSDNGTYTCIVKNAYGSDTSLNYVIELGVNGAPVFQNSKTIQSGGAMKIDSSFMLIVSASGTPAPTFSWLKNDIIIEGKTDDTLVFASLALNDTGTYRCIAENINGKDTTVAFSISLDSSVIPDTNTKPVILNNGQIEVSGKDSINSTFLLFITAEGKGQLTYQWYKNSTAISDATNDTLTFVKLSASDSGSYFCIVANEFGDDMSSVYIIQLGGVSKPVIQNSKQVQITGKQYKDSVVKLSVTATGTAPLTFAWFKENSATALSVTDELVFSKFTLSDTGNYFCIVTNVLGSDTSKRCALTMLNRRPDTNKIDTVKLIEDDTAKTGINISGNDPDGDSLTWKIISGPFKGTVGNVNQGKLLSGDELAYVPKPDSNGIDSIEYFLSDGKVNSDTASIYISIISAKDSVIILRQPENQNVKPGQSAQFTIAAAGANLQYQWLRNSTDIAGATGTSCIIPAIAVTDNGTAIKCKVYNSEDTVYSDDVSITVVHNVIYNDNSASTGNVPLDTNSYALGTSVVVPGNTGNLVKNGHTFKGWNLQSDGSGVKTYIANDTMLMPLKDITLYAKWVIDTLTVTFNTNGGSAVPSQKVIYNQLATEPATEPAKAGNVFNGWYTSSSGTGAQFDFATPILASRTVYAGWTPVYQVIYNENGGTGSVPIDNNQYKSGDMVSVAGSTGISLRGFSFTEWSTTRSGAGTGRTPGSAYQKGPGNDTLFARWNIIQYNITYVLNGGSANSSNPTTYNVQSPALPLQSLTPKTDSTFEGWYADATLSTKITSIPANSIGDDTLYAKWTWAGTITDIDGNTYPTVKIGNQIWTSVNLRVTHYNDGTEIPKTPLAPNYDSYGFYGDTIDVNFQKKYGALYSRGVVNMEKFAPKGWHVPTAKEWDTLRTNLLSNGFYCEDSYSIKYVGKAIASKTDWNSTTATEPCVVGNNLSDNNSSGFNAFPAGYKESGSGYFRKVGLSANWWVPTTAGVDDICYIELVNNRNGFYGTSRNTTVGTCSVRLIKDQ